MNEKIVAARLEAGLSQKELAEKINIRPQRMYEYEKGKRNPKIEVIKKIAEATNKDILYFLDA